MRLAWLLLLACGSSDPAPAPPPPPKRPAAHAAPRPDASEVADAADRLEPDGGPRGSADAGEALAAAKGVAITVRTSRDPAAIELAGAIPQADLGACFATDPTPVELGFDVTARGTTDKVTAKKKGKATDCVLALAAAWQLPAPPRPTHVEITVAPAP